MTQGFSHMSQGFSKMSQGFSGMSPALSQISQGFTHLQFIHLYCILSTIIQLLKTLHKCTLKILK